ncbi:hypothetical protein CFD26_106194 [Aspergillus turcosus]|uniref:Xylanolytic transcriptional activator regulatory domain-containing protein n=1 Tax=Aspergillus turcosus TaxID=1245748 RepID=A0A421D997_9EURO|nr:hypothetical protein CFD26_106194 [Aspergillus turcosus]
MSSVSIFGLGAIGTALASWFHEEKYKVTVWNRSPEKAGPLLDKVTVLNTSTAESWPLGSPHALIPYSGSPTAFEATEADLSPLAKCVFLGEDAGSASLHDLALLSGMYGLFSGFPHAIALVRSSTTAVKFVDLLVPRLGAMTEYTKGMAKQIDEGKYASEGWNLALQLVAIQNIIDASAAQQVSADFIHPRDPVDDQLISLYYRYFHSAHPCAVPRFAIQRYVVSDRQAIQPLYAVMKYIGSLHNPLIPSAQLKDQVEAELAVVRNTNHVVSPFAVQAVLLYAIAVYWCDETRKGLDLLEEAIQMALGLGMNRSDFATQNGRNDPILEESWRRTWWQVYITDAHIAGSTHTYPFRTTGIQMDVRLPCEEAEYESGNIPNPRTLEEYDMREFADDEHEFSSFAELVGLTRSLDLALASRQDLDIKNISTVCANVDTIHVSWTSLLPPSKKTVFRSDGSLDEILFKAHAIIHTWIVDLHRQLSTLAYSTIEGVAYCCPPAPPESLLQSNSPESDLHTRRVLHSIERFESLLTLPTNIVSHTPFIICMIAIVAIAHLSACRYVFKGQELRLNRERIRAIMGTLKAMGEHWSLGKRTYQEISVIAREILSLDRPLPSPPASREEQTTGVYEVMTDISAFAFAPDMAVEPLDFCDLFDIDYHEATIRDALSHDLVLAECCI